MDAIKFDPAQSVGELLTLMRMFERSRPAYQTGNDPVGKQVHIDLAIVIDGSPGVRDLQHLSDGEWSVDWVSQQVGAVARKLHRKPGDIEAGTVDALVAAIVAGDSTIVDKGGRPKGTGGKARAIRKAIEKSPTADDSDIALKCDATPKYVKQIRGELAADKMRSAVEIGTE